MGGQGAGRWGAKGWGAPLFRARLRAAQEQVCVRVRTHVSHTCVCTRGGGSCLHPSPSRKVSGLSHNNKDSGL